MQKTLAGIVIENSKIIKWTGNMSLLIKAFLDAYINTKNNASQMSITKSHRVISRFQQMENKSVIKTSIQSFL